MDGEGQCFFSPFVLWCTDADGEYKFQLYLQDSRLIKIIEKL
jgi:hypothetical protein